MPKARALGRFTRTRRCKHVHLSGRRCEHRQGRDAYGDIALFCGLHKGKCAECGAMLAAFPPPKGWSDHILKGD